MAEIFVSIWPSGAFCDCYKNVTKGRLHNGFMSQQGCAYTFLEDVE